jgi:uncharacterized membrane protein SpoIIM required for sporulation
MREVKVKRRALEIIMAVLRALHRARFSILTIGMTYLVAILVGVIMVHTGNPFATSYRDEIVSNAQSSPIIVALNQNHRARAALLDAGGNFISAFTNTLGGLGVIIPYPFVAYRGWIGGIVSIDGSHVSRFADPQEALYYLTTLILQLIPSILAGGIGVNLGLSYYRPKPYYQGKKWLGLSQEAILDVARVYLLVIPLLLLASLWEFGMQ